MKRILPILASLAAAGLLAATASAQSLNYTNPYTISTLAGNTAGSSGYVNGNGTATRFNDPVGVAVDGAGNVYVADANNFAVRAITPAGAVTTLAGQAGIQGEADGANAAAKFGPIEGITIDPSGNLYVLDWVTSSGSAAVIRKISGGSVSTVAGVSLNQPLAIASDSSGNLFVADTGNNLIRKITAGGAVSNFAGVQGQNNNVDGPAASAQFGYPTGITVDGSGNVYVADAQQQTIRKISGGTVSTVAGAVGNPGDNDGTGGGASFRNPYGIAADASGNLFITTGDGLIREMTAAGVVSTVAGQTILHSNIDSSGQNASFNTPTGIAAGANSTIYIANTGYNTIRKGVALGGSGAPVIATQPSSETVQSAGTAMFQVAATGANLTYQWKLGGNALADSSGHVVGSQTATLTILNAAASDQGNYTVTVSNSSGAVTSNAAVLAVTVPPAITSQPTSTTVQAGATATFSVTATGANLSYQWSRRGTALTDGGRISGSSTANLSISGATAADQDNYSVTVSNLYGSAVSNAVSLTVSASVVVHAHLLNLSTLAQTTPASPLAVGFAVGGSGSKSLLIRADGPALAGQVPNVLPNPVLGLYDQPTSALLATNTGWTTSVNPSPSALQAAFTQVFAFNFPANSADSALLQTVAVGAVDSAQITGAAGTSQTGNALAEIYDADTAANPSARLVNLSSRATVVGTSAPLSAGFVIGGSGTETVLIRGIGPTLGSFHVQGTLPTLTLSLVNQNSSTPAVNLSNTGWDANLAATFSQVGAFALVAGSADCALLATLPAGNYTATVTGTNGASGIALIEVYEVSSQ